MLGKIPGPPIICSQQKIGNSTKLELFLFTGNKQDREEARLRNPGGCLLGKVNRSPWIPGPQTRHSTDGNQEVSMCPGHTCPSRYIEAPGPGGPTLSTFSLSTCSSDLLHPQPTRTMGCSGCSGGCGSSCCVPVCCCKPVCCCVPACSCSSCGKGGCGSWGGSKGGCGSCGGSKGGWGSGGGQFW